jgi:diacylglycerol kinase
MKTKFSIKARFQSFIYAFRGLKHLVKKEHNFRIHLLAIIVVLIAGMYYHISLFEWFFIATAITLVLVLEIINTGIERLANLIFKEKNDDIKIIKDIAATSVLIAAIFSVFIAFFIFYPKIVV